MALPLLSRANTISFAVSALSLMLKVSLSVFSVRLLPYSEPSFASNVDTLSAALENTPLRIDLAAAIASAGAFNAFNADSVINVAVVPTAAPLA